MDEKEQRPRWWQYGYVWLVLAGPVAVVIASAVTAWLAASRPDPVLAEDYYRQGLEINKRLARERAMAPALQGRNHAATPAATPAAN